MTAGKEKKKKLTKKLPHGDSGRAVVRVKGRSSSALKATSVYSALNGMFRVFYPIGPTRTPKRILADKVSRVVATMKD